MPMEFIRRMKIMSEWKIDENTMRNIRFSIFQLEKKNAKTHEKKDTEMVAQIVKIIQTEVDRTMGK